MKLFFPSYEQRVPLSILNECVGRHRNLTYFHRGRMVERYAFGLIVLIAR